MRKTLLNIPILILLVCSVAFGAGKSTGRVVMVVAGNASIADLTQPNLPHIAQLISTSSVALINVKTGRASKDIDPVEKPGMEAGCLSLGAGAMATGGAEVSRAGNSGQLIEGLSVYDLYKFRTGVDPKGAQLLHTQISRIQRINSEASYHALPGALGSALKSAGIKTAVIGNSDMPEDIRREAVAIAMTKEGTVDLGVVDAPWLVKADPASPFGVRANNNALIARLKFILKSSRFIVIDFGDTARADFNAASCTDQWAQISKHKAVAALDRLLAGVMKSIDPRKDTLILLSPNRPSFDEIQEEHLAPLIINGPGFSGGMLYSPSTRVRGLVTICDIAPTVLDIFGLKAPKEMVGRPASVVNCTSTKDELLTMNARANRQSDRLPAMRGSSVVQSVLVVLITAGIIMGAGGKWKSAAAWGALIPLAMPIAMLILPLIYDGGLVDSVLIGVVVIACILAGCALIFRSASRAFVWMCGIIAAALVTDMALGAPVSSSSIAGYGLAEGSRYYGIGNELMGTLLGVTLLGLASGLSARRPTRIAPGIIIAAVFLVVFIAIGAPFLGANMGGAMAAIPAMAVTLMVRRGWRPNLRGLALLALIVIVVTGGLFAFDALRSGSAQSHVGRVLGQATEGDTSGVLLLLQRKIALNFMLVVTSLWSRLLGLSILGSAVIYWWGSRKLGKVLSREESAAVTGTCFGIVAAFVFNDSGVVAAATCAVILWAFLSIRVLSSTDLDKK